MSEARNTIKSRYIGYPEAKEGPDTRYTPTKSSNPVLRGVLLTMISSASVIQPLSKSNYELTNLQRGETWVSLEFPMVQFRFHSIAKIGLKGARSQM